MSDICDKKTDDLSQRSGRDHRFGPGDGAMSETWAGLRPWVHLHLVPEVGAVTYRRLIARFGGPAGALAAGEAELRAVEGVGPAKAAAIVRGRDAVDPDAELARAEAMGVEILTLESPGYPAPLRYIHDPPALLYVRGRLAEGDSLAVAVVGSRECSVYGLEQASRLGAAMAAAGITVVSGLAKGIDTAAHNGALSVRGRTIAVLGSGLAEVYPPENKGLADRIAAAGAVISEFPLTARPAGHHFPMRNRIISGLSLGVLVVEAPLKSGSLITASLAVEQNREVFAVPGRVDMPGSKGCHALIRQGAKLVESLDDILDGLGEAGRLMREAAALDAARPAASPADDAPAPVRAAAPAKPARPVPQLTDDERKVFDCLDGAVCDVDEIVRRTAMAASSVNVTLTRLELKGLIAPQPGGLWARQ